MSIALSRYAKDAGKHAMYRIEPIEAMAGYNQRVGEVETIIGLFDKADSPDKFAQTVEFVNKGQFSYNHNAGMLAYAMAACEMDGIAFPDHSFEKEKYAADLAKAKAFHENHKPELLALKAQIEANRAKAKESDYKAIAITENAKTKGYFAVQYIPHKSNPFESEALPLLSKTTNLEELLRVARSLTEPEKPKSESSLMAAAYLDAVCRALGCETPSLDDITAEQAASARKQMGSRDRYEKFCMRADAKMLSPDDKVAFLKLAHALEKTEKVKQLRTEVTAAATKLLKKAEEYTNAVAETDPDKPVLGSFTTAVTGGRGPTKAVGE